MTQLGSSLLSSIGAAFNSLPYALFSSRNSNASPPTSSSNPAMAAFEADMLMHLERLKQAGENTHLDLDWLQKALVFVLFTHSTVAKAIPDLELPPTEKDEKLINDYLDDNVKLLDVCNVLKESFADVERYQMLIQLALHSLDNKESVNEKKLIRAKNVLHECIDAMKKKDEELDRQGQQKSKLENCSSMLRRMGEKLTTPVTPDGSKSSALLSAMYGAKATTIFICGVLAATLLVKPRRPLPSLHLTNHLSWSPLMLRLQTKVKEEIDKRKARGSSSALLHELDIVHLEVKKLYSLLEKMLGETSFSASREKMDEVRQSVGQLQKYAEELQKGMIPLENQIKELYRMLVSSRVALLGVLSHVRN
eukprot:Gb_00670 [translate_table: standard]